MVLERYAPTPTAWVRHIGVWDMQDLYESLVDWFRGRKYKFHELVYKHKHPSPFGVERQYIWRAERKENDYVQVQYDVYIHTYDAHDVEVVMKDGSKKEFTKGKVWIQLRVLILFDFEKRWDTKVFYKHLKEFYNKYVIRKRLMHGYSPKFRTEFYALHALIKERLRLESEGFEHRDWSGVYSKL